MVTNITEKPPLVSVVMPAYNAERFLAEAIESILSQSFTDFEFLIMDDGSTDSTWQILQDYTKKDERIKLFQQENKGVAFSLNYLISQAKGEFIARMDADDLSHPNRFQLQVDYLIQHPEVGMSVTAYVTIAPNGLAFLYGCPPESQSLVDLLNKGINPIAHGSVMIRTSVLMALKEPPYKLIREQDFEDIDLWKRLIKTTVFSVIKTPLFSVRRYSGCVTNRCSQDKNFQEIYDTDSHFDQKVALLLKTSFIQDQGYEYFLNARASFLHRNYLQALSSLVRVFFYPASQYKFKSLILIGLVILGPLGLLVYGKKKNRPYEYPYSLSN